MTPPLPVYMEHSRAPNTRVLDTGGLLKHYGSTLCYVVAAVVDFTCMPKGLRSSGGAFAVAVRVQPRFAGVRT